LALQDSRGLGVELTTPPWKRLITKSEAAIAVYFSWQKLLRKARGPRRAVQPMMMMMMIKDICPAFHVYTVQEVMFSSQSILRIQTTGNRLKFVHYINSS
jgi:hypothetical protein